MRRSMVPPVVPRTHKSSRAGSACRLVRLAAIRGRMVTMDKPRVAAFWMDGAPVADDDPLAAIKHRAHAISQAAEVLEEITRTAGVSVRADRLEEAAGLFGDDAFDPGEVWTAGRQVGLADEDLDSAANVAVVLWQVE